MPRHHMKKEDIIVTAPLFNLLILLSTKKRRNVKVELLDNIQVMSFKNN